MSLLCPTCRSPIDPTLLACAKQHQYTYEDGVLVLLEEKFGQQLRTFLATFQNMRAAENRRGLEATAYEQLPFAPAARGNFEWRLRRYSLAVVLKLLNGRGPQCILDVGAWNGWLSHHLAAQGHKVTAVDYFTDEYDGLRAKKFYSASWQAIQMDLTDLSVLQQRYDTVILNHCMQFFADPVVAATTARQLLAPGGLLILVGLQFFQNASQKILDMQALRTKLNHHGLDFFKPMKGYLDFSDKERLQTQQFSLRPYPQLWLAYGKSLFNKALPRHYYGVYRLTP